MLKELAFHFGRLVLLAQLAIIVLRIIWIALKRYAVMSVNVK